MLYPEMRDLPIARPVSAFAEMRARASRRAFSEFSEVRMPSHPGNVYACCMRKSRVTAGDLQA